MKYAVNEEGVRALRESARRLEECVALISAAASALGTAAEGHSAALGPHKSTIAKILEEIREAAADAAEPVETVSEMLDDVAESYQDVLDNDRFNHTGAGLGAVAAAGAAAGAAAVAGAGEKNSMLGTVGNVLSGMIELSGLEGGAVSAEAEELQRMGVSRVKLNGCDEKNRKEVLSAVKSMFEAHPELRGQLSEIVCKPMSLGVYAAYGPTKYGTPFGGRLNLNSLYFANSELADDLAEKSLDGWFVPNATPASIVMHELGHGLHLEMCALACGVKNGSILSKEEHDDFVDRYLDDEQVDEIVEQACEEVGVEFDSWEFSEQLSKYGGSNYGEAIAEAVAEVKCSPSPRPMARAIYAGVIKRLDELRKGL